LIPEYEVGTTILVACEDSSDAVEDLFDLVMAQLIPILESETRKQAELKYAGKYVSTSYSTKGTSSMEIVLDDGPGLKICSWIDDDEDMLFAFSKVAGLGSDSNSDARIHPVGVGDRWRIVIEGVCGQRGKIIVLSEACRSWDGVVRFRYGGRLTDELDFDIQGDKVIGVSYPGLRLSLVKVQ
jgi:hypothetical protein